MTSRRRYVIEIRNFDLPKSSSLLLPIMPQDLVTISQILSVLKFSSQMTYLMTSRRRDVIKFSLTEYFVTPAFVQSMIPLYLIRISPETKKFIALRLKMT